MRLREAVRLGREMLGRDECPSDTFHRVLAPEYRWAIEAMMKAVKRRGK